MGSSRGIVTGMLAVEERRRLGWSVNSIRATPCSVVRALKLFP